MRPVQVFISYRRDDTAGYARAIYDELASHFGADRVFIDVDDIQPGEPFAQVIQREIGAAKVLLVLIGRRWQGERADAPPRIEDPGDFVRREVAAGLSSTARVIPVLLDGATMPSDAQLPSALRALAGRNALEIDNTRYAGDMHRLLAVVREALGESAPAESLRKPGTGRRGIWVMGALVAGVVAVAMHESGVWRSDPIGSASADAPRATRVRPDINGLWRAQVSYDWPNAHYVERFDLRGEAGELHGTASFLGVPRGVLEGRVDAEGLRFVTRTTEVAGSASQDVVHRYSGRWVDGQIRFVMQTEGGSSTHAPVEFVAQRERPASAASSSP